MLVALEAEAEYFGWTHFIIVYVVYRNPEYSSTEIKFVLYLPEKEENF